MVRYIKTLVIGLLLVIAGDLLVGRILCCMYFNCRCGLPYRTTYSIEETNADILIFGASRANHHYDVKMIEDSTGLTVYNTGRDGNFIFYQTALLRSILKRYTPKLIVLDFSGSFEYRQQDYDRLSSILPYYHTHEELRDIAELKSPYEKYKLLSKIYPYNSMLTTVALGNLNESKQIMKEYRGFVPLQGICDITLDTLYIPEEYEIDWKKYSVFNEFFELTSRYDIPLIVIYSPVYYKYDKHYSLAICKMVCEEKNVTFLDFTKDSVFISNNRLFRDKTHLNSDGAKVFTQKVLGYIRNDCENYKLTQR